MNKIKIYYCALCQNREKSFRGIRKVVRNHLREEHGVKGITNLKNEKVQSNVTRNTLSEVFK